MLGASMFRLMVIASCAGGVTKPRSKRGERSLVLAGEAGAAVLGGPADRPVPGVGLQSLPPADVVDPGALLVGGEVVEQADGVGALAPAHLGSGWPRRGVLVEPGFGGAR